jgi:hypothetical protein
VTSKMISWVSHFLCDCCGAEAQIAGGAPHAAGRPYGWTLGVRVPALPERVSVIWRPLKAGHWCIGTKCVVCGEAFVEGDETCGVSAEAGGTGVTPGGNINVRVAHPRCTTPPRRPV